MRKKNRHPHRNIVSCSFSFIANVMQYRVHYYEHAQTAAALYTRLHQSCLQYLPEVIPVGASPLAEMPVGSFD